MSLFQILKNNQTVEIQQEFLKQNIDKKSQQDENQAIRRRFISMLYYGGYLTIKNLVGESTVVLGPPNLTVYQNLLTMFNNVHHFIALNKELNSYCNDSVPVTEDTWKNCLIELSIIQAGLHLLSTKQQEKRELNLTSKIACVLSPHLKDFLVLHQRQTKARKKPDIVIFQKASKKPIVVLQYLISQSDNMRYSQFFQHIARDYQNQYETAGQQVTVMVDSNDMKTILMAAVKRKGYSQDIIIGAKKQNGKKQQNEE